MPFMNCSTCGGSGEVAVVTGARTLDYPDGVRETDSCPDCGGSGAVPHWVVDSQPSDWWDYNVTTGGWER